MSFQDYEDALTGFAHLRIRPSALAEFGFRRKGGAGWEHTVPIDGTSLECRVSISAAGGISEKVVDLASGESGVSIPHLLLGKVRRYFALAVLPRRRHQFALFQLVEDLRRTGVNAIPLPRRRSA